MNTTIIIFLSIVFMAFVGMFYWMYKARKGTLNLSKNVWHFKLMNYMWEAETSDIRNACPYYWSLVLSILILVPYLIIRYLYVFYKYICSLFPEREKKEVKIKSPKIEVKETPSKYSYIYSRSKEILEYIMVEVWCAVGLLMLISAASNLYIQSVTAFVILLSVVVYSTTTVYLHITKPELDMFHWNHYRDFFSGLYGIIKIPFIVAGWILSSIFSKITDVYTDNCPGIVWE